MRLRNSEPHDYYFVSSVIDSWWGGRQLRDMLPKLFFIHFRDTSFIAESDDGAIIGFLNGFFSQTYPDVAYIHFVGVHPEHRKEGIARLLYETFFEVARAGGRTQVQCVTAPVNKTSIAFHRRMGFEIIPGDTREDGVDVHSNYDGTGGNRVLFIKAL